ncbi:MAG: hypothetical protein KBA31_14505 [Alphaproteobacteria bacterium]|nr:hypothetical protein [Alphaproteobacteria bacterium]
MERAMRAGGAYFLVVFAIGFVLGTIRTLFVIPRFGETNAILVELPVMLAASWIACIWLVRRFAVSTALRDRLAMGVVAFALLMLGELSVSMYGFGRTAADHVASYRTLGAQLGLAAQVLFALMPIAQAALRR